MKVYVLVKQFNSYDKTVMCGVTFSERLAGVWAIASHDNDFYCLDSEKIDARGLPSDNDRLSGKL